MVKRRAHPGTARILKPRRVPNPSHGSALVFTYSVQLSGSTPLLRQYFPKGTDLSVYSQEDLDYVAWEMNDRPRKRLDYLKPNEMIEPLLLR